MIPTRYDIYYERCAIDKKNNGDYVLYADAEKWVGEEVAALKAERIKAASDYIRDFKIQNNEIIRQAEEIAKKDEEETQTRLFLLLNHGHSAPYLDDGEMQCSECIPNWDYKRLPLKTLISQMLGLKAEQIATLKESFNKERAKRCQCEFDGGECFSPCKYHGKKDEQIATLTKFKKSVENDRCTECPFLEKETEREAEIAGLKERVKEDEKEIKRLKMSLLLQ